MAETPARPFVKWAGGKRLLTPRILPLLPQLSRGSTYFEPFLGGGAVFFAYRPPRSILSDANAELIEVFEAVRDEPQRVIRHLKKYKHDKDAYYAARTARPRTPAGRAARFIYLNKTCFNGLYRVNRRGEFNVPFGTHGKNLVICDEDQIKNAAEALARAILRVGDFEVVVNNATAGDVAYFDPPYITAHTNNGFVEYNAHVFSWDDQRRLAKVARQLVERGVHVFVSNANHPSITTLYAGFIVHHIHRASTMAGAASKRFRTTEVVFESGN